MLTNLIAGIVLTLSTNVFETNNAEKWSQSGKMYGFEIVYMDVPAKPATEKYETTIVTEKRTLEFEVEGKKFNELLSERTVLSTTRTYKLKQEWVDAGMKTNELFNAGWSTGIPAPGHSFFAFSGELTPEEMVEADRKRNQTK